MLGAAALLGVRLQAQIRQPVMTQRVLLLAPTPTDPADSAYAVEFGDELRGRLEGKSRRQLTVITKDKIGEALEASGFGRDALLDESASKQLAQFLQSDAYIVGRLEKNPTPKADIHLFDLRGRSGLSGWVHVTGPKGVPAKQFAAIVADSLDPQIRAAEATRDCLDRRDKRDFIGAKERARKAFESVPNHPAAATCLAVVFEALKDPPDSLIPVYQKAVKGDSLNMRAWEALGRTYQAKGTHGDSLKAADAFLRQLQADPGDSKLRTGIAALLITLKEYAHARDVLDEGSGKNPGDLQALQLKARACEEGGLWKCLIEALAAQYQLDSSLVGKVDFYGKILGAAQRAADSAAVLKWSGEAVKRLPNEIAFWRARADALKAAGRQDSALAAYRRVADLDKTDYRAPLQIVQIYLDRVKIDSTAPLDGTARARVESRVDSLVQRRLVPAAKRDSVLKSMFKQEYVRQLTDQLDPVDSLLQRVAALRSADTTVSENVAVMYFKPGTELVQKHVSFPLGARWLEQSLKYDVRKQLLTQAKFFLGLAYFFPLPDFDTQLRVKKSCDMVAQEAETVAKAKDALTAGASVSPQTANQLLQYIGQFEQLIPQYRQAYKCRA